MPLVRTPDAIPPTRRRFLPAGSSAASLLRDRVIKLTERARRLGGPQKDSANRSTPTYVLDRGFAHPQ
jgi:hypothetical protein